MAENTNESPTEKLSIEKTKATPSDEVESAKILFQEGLLEEAKKILHRLLIEKINFKPAQLLLDQIRKQEEQKLLADASIKNLSRTIKHEDPDLIRRRLEQDLGIVSEDAELPSRSENFIVSESLSVKEHYDLGIAFFEMDCHLDAVRELKRAERKIRLEKTFLDSEGVSVVALYVECLVKLGRAYEAESYLKPILSEPELRHEDKIVLFYLMGVIELELEHPEEARGWFQKVLKVAPGFRDAEFRLKQIL